VSRQQRKEPDHELLEIRNAIQAGCAGILHGNAWASLAEEEGVSLSQKRIEDICGPTPRAARKVARAICRQKPFLAWLRANRAIRDPMRIGEILAYNYIGAGVGWADIGLAGPEATQPGVEEGEKVGFGRLMGGDYSYYFGREETKAGKSLYRTYVYCPELPGDPAVRLQGIRLSARTKKHLIDGTHPD